MAVALFLSPLDECLCRLFSDHKIDVKVGFASLNRPAIRQYSPVKNNLMDAVQKQQSGLEPACASAGEMDVYRYNCDLLRPGGMKIGIDIDAEFLGIQVKIPPAVSLSAEFCMSRGTNVVGGSLAPGSTLICKGNGQIHLHNVHVDGTLVIEACEGATVTLENIKVRSLSGSLRSVVSDRMFECMSTELDISCR